MIVFRLTLMAFFAFGFFAYGQEHVHVHGKGKLLISQQGSIWNLQFILPAKDVLGFEHEAETDEESATLLKMAKRLLAREEVVRLNGKCSLTDKSNSLSEEHAGHHEVLNSSHDHQDEEHEHHDVEVEYQFDCQSSVTQIEIKLFNSLDSLSQIEAQWITEQSQGMARLTRSQPFVEW